MRTYVLASAVAALILLSAGCGEGPLYMEDASALASGDSSENEPKSDSGRTLEEDRSFDPDQQREIEEEKEEQQEEEEKEAVKEDAIKDGAKIADILSEYIHKMEFDKAVEKFEEYAEAVEVAANEGMSHEKPEVQEGYKLWREGLYKLLEYLKEGTDEPERKKAKARMMLDEAAQAKRAAEFAKRME